MKSGRIPGCENSDFYFSIDTAFWVHLFYFTESKKTMIALSSPLNAHQIRFFLLLAPKTLQNGISLKIGGVCPRFLVSHSVMISVHVSLHFRGGAY